MERNRKCSLYEQNDSTNDKLRSSYDDFKYTFFTDSKTTDIARGNQRKSEQDFDSYRKQALLCEEKLLKERDKRREAEMEALRSKIRIKEGIRQRRKEAAFTLQHFFRKIVSVARTQKMVLIRKYFTYWARIWRPYCKSSTILIQRTWRSWKSWKACNDKKKLHMIGIESSEIEDRIVYMKSRLNILKKKTKKVSTPSKSLKTDEQSSELEIGIIAARGLVYPTAANLLHRSGNILVTILLVSDGVVVHQDQTSESNLSENPQWEYTNCFSIPVAIDEIHLVLKQDSSVNSDGFLGQLSIPLSLAVAGPTGNGILVRWYPLDKRTSKDFVSGEIKVLLRLKGGPPKTIYDKDKDNKRWAKPVRTSMSLEKLKKDETQEPLSTKHVPEKVSNPYLKRKPYKICFQKLDWSNIKPRIDSRLKRTPSQSSTSSSTPTTQAPLPDHKKGIEENQSSCGKPNSNILSSSKKNYGMEEFGKLFKKYFPESRDSSIPRLTLDSLFLKNYNDEDYIASLL